MRFQDFKLVESKIRLDELTQNPDAVNIDTMDMDQALEFIDTQSEKADPALKQKVLNYLQKFKAHLLGEVPTTNETIDQAIDAQVADIERLLEKADRQPTPQELEYIQHVAKLLLSTGAQIGHTEINKIKAEIESLYAPIANKIINGGDAFHSKDPVVEDSEDDEYAEEVRIKRSELSKTGQAVANTIADMTNAVMEKAGRQEAIEDAETELLKIKEFLERCLNDPFIDFDSLISQSHGTIEQEFAKKGSDFVDVYNQFENILGRTIDKSGAGAWGPAELGLLLLSNPVKKGDKGDIVTGNGVEVEVKASKKANSGARLNVEQATKGNLVNSYNPILKSYFGNEITMPDGNSVKVQHETPMGQVNFTIKGFTILNDWIDHMISIKEWNKNKAIQFLVDSINVPMQNYVGDKGTNYDSSLKKHMSKVVTKDGKLDFQTFQKEYTKLLFAIYKSEMLDCILVINPILGTFIVMNDPTEVDKAIDTGLVISGGIDFKDKQSTKSPQIGIGKLLG